MVPFYELAAFTNASFPELLKKVKASLLAEMLIGDTSNFILRFFDLGKWAAALPPLTLWCWGLRLGSC